MRKPNSKPRSAQRQAVLALFEKQDVVTKFDVSAVIGLGLAPSANLLSAMAQDNVIARGADIPAKSGSPTRTFVRARKAGGFNPFLKMAIRRKNNAELGIESVRGWA